MSRFILIVLYTFTVFIYNIFCHDTPIYTFTDLLCFAYICYKCSSYSDKTLANILTPREKLCGKKFELRVDDVLFVGHPTLVTPDTQTQVMADKYQYLNNFF